jgi:hypothetical protein
MIAILTMILTAGYFFYMISLIVPAFSSILIISLCALIYIVCIGIVNKKPEISIYFFLIIFLFFPKTGDNYVLVQVKEEYPIYFNLILQSVAAFSIALQLVIKNRVKRKIPKKLNVFCNLFAVTYFITLLSTLFYQTQGSYLGVTFTPESAAGGAPFLFSYIFLLGCINFITKTEQIEKIFIILIVAGFTMVADIILTVHLALPLPYAYRALHESGRFQSIIYADYWFVGYVIITTIGCTLFYIYSREKYIFLGAVPLLFLPIIATYQRANMFSALCVVILFLLFSIYYVKTNTAYVVTIVVGILASMLVLVGGVFLEFLVSAFKGETRPDYFISYLDSWVSRLGAHARGLDVIYHFFPLGTGPSLMNEFMASPALPIYFPVSQDWQRAYSLFYKIASGRHITGAHNFFIQFIGEYGLMGGIIESLFIYNCFSNFLFLRRYAKMTKYRYSKSMLMFASTFAILFGIGVQAMYQHHTSYIIPLFFFYLTFLTPDDIK